jgi:hypothetical protein
MSLVNRKINNIQMSIYLKFILPDVIIPTYLNQVEDVIRTDSLKRGPYIIQSVSIRIVLILSKRIFNLGCRKKPYRLLVRRKVCNSLAFFDIHDDTHNMPWQII